MCNQMMRSASYFLMSLYMVNLFDLSSGYTLIGLKSNPYAHEKHRIDTEHLVIYSVLLTTLLTILTIWLFKIHRFKYIHETGLAIIYGLICGSLIKYACNQSTEFTFIRVMPSILRHNNSSSIDQSTNLFLNENIHQNGLILTTETGPKARFSRNLVNASLERLNKDIPFANNSINSTKLSTVQTKKTDLINSSSTEIPSNDTGRSINESTTVTSTISPKMTTIKPINSTLELTTQQAKPSTENTLKPTLPVNQNSSIKPTLSSNLKNDQMINNRTTNQFKNKANDSQPNQTEFTGRDSKKVTAEPTIRPTKNTILKFKVINSTSTEPSNEFKENHSSRQINKMNNKNELTFILPAPPDLVYINLDIKDRSQNLTLNKSYVYLLEGELVNRDTSNVNIFRKATFDPNFFLNVIIPLIVFNAGYSLKRRFFFRNLGAIFTYSVFGTLISSLSVALVLWTLMFLLPTPGFTFTDCLFFGAIISSTDTGAILSFFNYLNVDVNLYALVLGESVLSDAVVIVLVRSLNLFEQDLPINSSGDQNLVFSILHTIKCFCSIFLFSFLIGFLVSILNALLTKFTKLKEFYLLESSLFVLMSYSAFMISELLELSGIVTILFCGIFQAHYNYHNLSAQSQELTKKLSELISFLAENFIFTYLGISMFIDSQHRWAISVIIFSFVAIIFGRLLNIYPLSMFLNLNRSNKIPFKYQTVLFFSNLRGSVAYALAIQQTISDSRQIILTTTSIIIIVTMILGGPLLSKLMHLLNIDTGLRESDQEMKPFSKNNQHLKSSAIVETEHSDANKSFTSINHQIDQNQNFLSQQCLNDKAWLVRKWYIFDKLFLKPLLTNSSPTLIDTFPNILLPISRLLTTNEQLNNSINSTYSDTTSGCGFNNVNFTGIASDNDLVDYQERNSNYQRYSFENNSNFEANYLSFNLNDNRQQLNEILETTLERSVGQLVQNNGDTSSQIIFDRLAHNQSQGGKQVDKQSKS